MKGMVLQKFASKNGKTFCPGDVIENEEGKLLNLSERGLVRILDEDLPLLEAEETGVPDMTDWWSPVSGFVSGPILIKGKRDFRLHHPITDEVITLPNKWLGALQERASILERKLNLPKEEAEAWARRDLFSLFRK